jgi:hypothetical protein
MFVSRERDSRKPVVCPACATAMGVAGERWTIDPGTIGTLVLEVAVQLQRAEDPEEDLGQTERLACCRSARRSCLIYPRSLRLGVVVDMPFFGCPEVRSCPRAKSTPAREDARVGAAG